MSAGSVSVISYGVAIQLSLLAAHTVAPAVAAAAAGVAAMHIDDDDDVAPGDEDGDYDGGHFKGAKKLRRAFDVALAKLPADHGLDVTFLTGTNMKYHPITESSIVLLEHTESRVVYTDQMEGQVSAHSLVLPVIANKDAVDANLAAVMNDLLGVVAGGDTMTPGWKFVTTTSMYC